jgi:hypothetical protein
MDVADLPPFRRSTSELTSAQLRRALRAGDLVPMRRGVLVGRRCVQLAASDRDGHLVRLRAAVLAIPGPPVVAGLPDRHLTTVDGIPTTDAARTVVDLARWISYRSGVVVADSALRGGVSPPELAATAADCARWPGIRQARDVIAFADGLAASPLESVSRVAFNNAGLPPPRLQVPIGDPDWPDGHRRLLLGGVRCDRRSRRLAQVRRRATTLPACGEASSRSTRGSRLHRCPLDVGRHLAPARLGRQPATPRNGRRGSPPYGLSKKRGASEPATSETW